MNTNRTVIDISLSAILKVFGVLLGLWFVYQVRDILLLLFLVLIIVMSLDPIVSAWQRRMPRAVAVALLFVLILGIFSLILGVVVPPLVNQLGELAANLPSYTEQLQHLGSSFTANGEGLAVVQRFLQSISEQLTSATRGVFNTTLGILGGLVSFLTVIVLSVYLLLEETGFRNFIVSLLPVRLEQKESIFRAITKIGEKLGAWLRGQLILMLVIGLAATVLSAALGLNYALPLGLWAGLTEVIPFLGPILGGIPIVIIAFLDSPLKALIALIFLVITQQLESNFLVPKIMQKSVGLSPVIVIIALMIGGKLFGISGTILSVPIAATIMVIIQQWPQLTKRTAKA